MSTLKVDSFLIGDTVPVNPAEVVLNTTVVSSPASVLDFSLPSGYAMFRLEFFGVQFSNNAVQFLMRTSTDGGSTFDSGASDYDGAQTAVTHAGTASYTGGAGTSLKLSHASQNIGNDGSHNALVGEVDIIGAGEASYTWALMHLTHHEPVADGDDFVQVWGCGVRAGTGVVDAIRLGASAGTIDSGTFRLIGFKENA